jgi:hypothetical protein
MEGPILNLWINRPNGLSRVVITAEDHMGAWPWKVSKHVIVKSRSRPVLRYCPGICLQGVIKFLSTDSWYLDHDLNREPHEYMFSALSLHQCSY